MAKCRLDLRLVQDGLAPSRSQAQAMILAGKVRVNGAKVDKAGFQVPEDAAVEALGPEHPYVSRGGLKLAGALEQFKLDVRGFNCLDVGASTGGFTDCLLQKGAAASTAVDVGYGQLAWKLRSDERVTVHERINVRYIPDDVARGPFDLICIDVSFISLTLVLPPLVARLKPGGVMLPMVKPQFELDKSQVGSGGVVRDPALRQKALDKIKAFCSGELGLDVSAECENAITGPKGNHEFFVLAQKPA